MEEKNFEMSSRPARKISILTDDGLYQEIEDEETQFESFVEQLNRCFQVFNSFEKDTINAIIKKKNVTLQKLRKCYLETYQEVLFSYLFFYLNCKFFR